MVIPTEFPTADPFSQTDAEVQGNLLREYEEKFSELPEQEKLTKICSKRWFLEGYWKNDKCFITLEERLADTKTSCREYQACYFVSIFPRVFLFAISPLFFPVARGSALKEHRGNLMQ